MSVLLQANLRNAFVTRLPFAGGRNAASVLSAAQSLRFNLNPLLPRAPIRFRFFGPVDFHYGPGFFPEEFLFSLFSKNDGEDRVDWNGVFSSRGC